MDALVRVPTCHLPERFQRLFDPREPIPRDVRFLRRESSPALWIAMAILFGVPCVIGAVAMTGALVQKLAAGAMLREDWLVAPAFVVFLWAVPFALLHHTVRSFQVRKLIREGRWRCGIFFLDDALLIHPSPRTFTMLPRAAVKDIEEHREAGGIGPSKGYVVVEVHYMGDDGETYRHDLETTDFEDGLQDQVARWFGKKTG